MPIKLSPTAPEPFALFIYLFEVLIQSVKQGARKRCRPPASAWAARRSPEKLN
jgi:hypothetical protein